MRVRVSAALAAIASFAIGCSSASSNNGQAAVVVSPAAAEAGVAYATTSSTTVLDVYAPTASGSVVLVLHGGAWLSGSRLEPDMHDVAEALAPHDHTVLVVDYRLTTEALWPAQVEDGRAAIAWARARFPGRIVGVLGLSAGGTIALELAEEADFVVAVSAPADLRSPTSTSQWGQSLASAFRHDAPFSAAEVESISPALTPPAKARVLLVHGIADDQVSVSNSDAEYHALLAAGAQAQYERVNSDVHGAVWESVKAELLDFLAAK